MPLHCRCELTQGLLETQHCQPGTPAFLERRWTSRERRATSVQSLKTQRSTTAIFKRGFQFLSPVAISAARHVSIPRVLLKQAPRSAKLYLEREEFMCVCKQSKIHNTGSPQCVDSLFSTGRENCMLLYTASSRTVPVNLRTVPALLSLHNFVAPLRRISMNPHGQRSRIASGRTGNVLSHPPRQGLCPICA